MSVGIGIIQLVVESEEKAGALAKSLIAKVREEQADAITQQQIIESIETIVVYKFPNLSREEVETMLGLSELKQTRVYQEALAEGREEGIQQGIDRGIQEGIDRGQLQAKLEIVSRLRQRGFSIEEQAELSGLDVETIRQAIEQ